MWEHAASDELTLPGAVLGPWREPIAETLRGTIEAVLHVGRLASNLVLAEGGIGEQADGQRRDVIAVAADRIDRPLRAWLTGLDPAVDLIAAREAWHHTAWKILHRLADEMTERATPRAIVAGHIVDGRRYTAAEASLWCGAALTEALPREINPEPADALN